MTDDDGYTATIRSWANVITKLSGVGIPMPAITAADLDEWEHRALHDEGAQGDHQAFHGEMLRLIAEVRYWRQFTPAGK